MSKIRSGFTASMLCALMVVFVFAISSALAGPFDTLKSVVPGASSAPAGSPNISRSDIDGLYKEVSDAEFLLQKSVNYTFRMVANEEKIAEMDMKQKEIEKIQDPQERAAAMRKLYEEESAIVEEALTHEDTAKKIESLDAEQKKLFAYSVFNVLLAGLKDAHAAEISKNIAAGLKANPAVATRFAADTAKVTGIASTIPSQTVKTVELGGNLSKLAKRAGCQVSVPQSCTTQPMDIEVKSHFMGPGPS